MHIDSFFEMLLSFLHLALAHHLALPNPHLTLHLAYRDSNGALNYGRFDCSTRDNAPFYTCTDSACSNCSVMAAYGGDVRGLVCLSCVLCVGVCLSCVLYV